MGVTVTRATAFDRFNQMDVETVKLWCYDTASTDGAWAGSHFLQFPHAVYGRLKAASIADRVSNWAKDMADQGQSLASIKGNLKHRMNERGISYDGSCSRGIA